MSTKEEIFEKVKIELRSILLSSKHGVEEKDIQSDYELLSCQRLPYKDLGFKDVRSLLKAMPDVAKEVRSPNGEIVYHAVCDESTAHIQKMVSKQVSKKKIRHPAGRGRGRGRGGYRGRGHVFIRGGGQGSLNRSSRPLYTRPRAPHFSRAPIHSGKIPLLSRFGQNIHIPQVSPLAPVWSYRNETISNELTDRLISENRWNYSESDNAKSSRMSRAIVGRDTSVLTSSQFDVIVDPGQNVSPIYNLKIGVNQTGKRVISQAGNILRRIGSDGDNNARDTDTSSYQFDLRDRIIRRRALHAAAENHDHEDDEMDFRSRHTNMKTRVENRTFQKNIPPRLQRKQYQQESTNQEYQDFLPVEPQVHFSQENTVYSMEKNNWIPPEDGALYLQAYYNYFVQEGMAVPEIEIISAKLNKEKGYYGRLMHKEKHYYPLEIMKTEEQARQNVARAFCLKNGITLPKEQIQIKPEQDRLSSSVNNISLGVNNTPSRVNETPSRVNDNSHRARQVLSEVEANVTESRQEVKSSQMSKQPFLPEFVQASSPSHQRQVLPETLQKVYKILKPNGIWVPMLDMLYQASYAEPLNMDFLSVAGQWPEYFTIEQLAPNRYTVYPVPDALTKKPIVNDISSEMKIKDVTKTSVPVPPALLPPVGSKLDVLFSFAYSPEDMYFQRADMENLAYEIDEVLNQKCPTTTPPDVGSVTVNCLMAAIYMGSWYRTQINAVEKEVVSVYFIDYGNSEKVSLADLRPVPHVQLILETPSLAIRFALRKSKMDTWCNNVTSILTELSEKHPLFSATILECKDDQCVVDLCTPDGSLVNDLFIQPAPTTPVQQIKPVLQRTESRGLGQEQLSKASPLGSGIKLFADDPEPLVIPDTDTFAVYVCRVMSENSVLLRIVDDGYSEKLDELEQKIAENFYSWPIPKQIKHSNIYAGMVLASAEDAEDVEYDEEGTEKLSDQNKYHRIRVLKENKDASCDCYLPDHGDNEVLNRNQLREIDPHLNLSLSYQAVMAKLHGLDKLPDKLKPMAVRLLIKLLTIGLTYYAVKKGNSVEKEKCDSVNIDTNITNRVRKIISCMRDIQPAKVAQIYQDVYDEPVENVEEVIKNIPGYGYWRESLEVDLIDTSQEDSDVNINETVLAAIEEMEKVQSQGGNAEDVWSELFSSNTSQADTDSESWQEGPDGFVGKERLPDALNKLDSDRSDDEAKLSHVRNYVQGLTRSASQDDSIKSTSSKTLYTWNTKPEITNGAVASCETPSPSSSSSPASLNDNTCLPKFWKYPLLTFVSVQIVRVENPSDFVAIPMEQRGALEKLEGAIAQYFATNVVEPAISFIDDVLYTVKSNNIYRRTLYLDLLGDVVRVFFPDHHSYDTVLRSELFLLPKQFYSLPFLAHKMRLGGVVPVNHEWPVHVIQWFKKTVCNKCLYALVTGEEGSLSDSRLPGTLVVRLIDTNGSEDLVVEEYMESQGMAVRESSSD